MIFQSLITSIYTFATLHFSACSSKTGDGPAHCSISSGNEPKNDLPFPREIPHIGARTPVSLRKDVRFLEDAFSALSVLQNEYFEAGRNTWPSSIDWTAAVIETVVSGMLRTLTSSLDYVVPGDSTARKAKENLVSSFYDQIVSYYFGQDTLAIADQAFDDILWVVLGWIETTNFVMAHEELHFPEARNAKKDFPLDIDTALESLPWRGRFWLPAFNSRARSFWNLGAQGWDTTLCHGGMNWNPRLETYKNAITNELYISASISMYQYLGNVSYRTKDPVYLQAAIEGYKWLINSNMTNSQGLFTDGFHIDKRKAGNVECDVRDEMVYTYNQGVVLTGQRELWSVTGSPSYLDDGHELIRSVIKATGWSLETDTPIDKLNKPRKLPPWRGLGRGGILEEKCDASATCSQDSQTFKGIYFHHLTAFCRPLDLNDIEEGFAPDLGDFEQVKTTHATACRAYLGWIKHNALAALRTRDDRGRFGMWWGAVFGDGSVSQERDGIDHTAVNTTDYRNYGTPKDRIWGQNDRWLPGTRGGRVMSQESYMPSSSDRQVTLEEMARRNSGGSRGDLNDRGRGRTVETQVGGVAVLRAYWEIARSLA